MKIVDTQDATPVEVLQALSEDEDDLKPAQQMNLDYLRRNLRIQDEESFGEMQEELGAVDDLKEKHILKLLEILPEHEQEVNTIFSKERLKLDDSDVEQIVEICRSFESN